MLRFYICSMWKSRNIALVLMLLFCTKVGLANNGQMIFGNQWKVIHPFCQNKKANHPDSKPEISKTAPSAGMVLMAVNCHQIFLKAPHIKPAVDFLEYSFISFFIPAISTKTALNKLLRPPQKPFRL